MVEENGKQGKGKKKKQDRNSSTDKGRYFLICYQTTEGISRTLRIDSKMLAEAESEDPQKNRGSGGRGLASGGRNDREAGAARRTDPMRRVCGDAERGMGRE